MIYISFAPYQYVFESSKLRVGLRDIYLNNSSLLNHQWLGKSDKSQSSQCMIAAYLSN